MVDFTFTYLKVVFNNHDLLAETYKRIKYSLQQN